MAAFTQLPAEVNWLIGSYLDYDSRMNFSRHLPSIRDKFVKRLNSDAHNAAVMVAMIRDSLIRFDQCNTRRKKALQISKLFRVLSGERCKILFRSQNFKQTVIEKTTSFMDPDSHEYANINRNLVKRVIGNARRLFNKIQHLNDHNAPTTLKSKLVEII